MTLRAKLLDFTSELTVKEQDCFAVILRQPVMVGSKPDESLVRAYQFLNGKTQSAIHDAYYV